MNLKKILNELKNKDLYRKFRTVNSSSNSVVKFKDKKFIMLASNNYFGLNKNKKVINSAKKALEKYGSGNVSSRLIVNLDLHEKLEKEIAKFKKSEAALAYSSGYSANLGVISSLDFDYILSDELNHSSIIDGCRLSKAKVIVYKHCDVVDLELKLKKTKNLNESAKILVVTDSVFSMEGDIAPLKEIFKLKKKYKFNLLVDDAHATGIINTNFKEIDIKIGTLSKSLASLGGYVAGRKELIDFLKNKSRSFMYSTGLSPADTAAALESLKIIKKNKNLKLKLLKNANYLRNNLEKLGFIVGGELQIIPLYLENNNIALKFQKLLEKDKIFIAAIRYPTVPKPILRISVMSTHTKAQLDKVIGSFEKIGKKLKLSKEL